jgi:hypothetical protein
MLSNLAGEEIERLLADGERIVSGMPSTGGTRVGEASGGASEAVEEELDADAVDALLRDAAAVLDSETTEALSGSTLAEAAPAGAEKGRKSSAMEIAAAPAAREVDSSAVVTPASENATTAAGADDQLANELDALFAELHKADDAFNNLVKSANKSLPTTAAKSAAAPEAVPDPEEVNSAQADGAADEHVTAGEAPVPEVAQADVQETAVAATGEGDEPEASSDAMPVATTSAMDSVTSEPSGGIVRAEVERSGGFVLRSHHTSHVGPPFVSALTEWSGAREESENIFDSLPDVKRNRLGWLLWPLVLINRPFESMSQDLRDLAGKLAILTLVNSALVIGYVMLFRK